MSERAIKVLIAEDSQTTRILLTSILTLDPSIEIIGEAANGLEAIDMAKKLRPDVITMDIRMPQLDGFEATRQIMIDVPTPIVIVSGSIQANEVVHSMHALRIGALSVVSKPVGVEFPDFEDQARKFIDLVKAMSQVKVVRRWSKSALLSLPPLQDPPSPTQESQSPQSARLPPRTRPRVVAIGASTGGPAALARILTELPHDFALPILIVQHIAKGFTNGLAHWLNTVGGLRVKVAVHNEPLQPRTVYLAPDDEHLGVASYQRSIALTRAEAIEGFRPSINFLYESVAAAFGSGCIAVILTGMGQDGVEGLKAVRRERGRVIAQDAESSVVFGMPAAAMAAGVVDYTLSLSMIASRLTEIVAYEERLS